MKRFKTKPMKKKLVLSITILVFTTWVMPAQVSIGKETVDGSGILDFGSENRGLLLSNVTDATAIDASAGTIVFDAKTGSVRFHNGTGWSVVIPGGITGSAPPGTDSGTGVIIGAETSEVEGILRLESSKLSLILPKASNAEFKIQSPEPGLMVYDPFLKRVLIYNGNYWTSF